MNTDVGKRMLIPTVFNSQKAFILLHHYKHLKFFKNKAQRENIVLARCYLQEIYFNYSSLKINVVISRWSDVGKMVASRTPKVHPSIKALSNPRSAKSYSFVAFNLLWSHISGGLKSNSPLSQYWYRTLPELNPPMWSNKCLLKHLQTNVFTAAT